jgi:putative membrane protein
VRPPSIKESAVRAILLSSLVLLILSGCSDSDPAHTSEATTGPDVDKPLNNAPEQGKPGPPSGMRQAPAAELAPADAEALGIVSAINQHEIAAAQQAQGRELPAEVNDYASMMIKDHSQNDRLIHQLGSPADSQAVQAQKSKGDSELAALGERQADYAKAYVEAMIKGHTEALTVLDRKLLPAAQAPGVKEHLKMTRTAVDHHLQQAKSLQSSQ